MWSRPFELSPMFKPADDPCKPNFARRDRMRLTQGATTCRDKLWTITTRAGEYLLSSLMT